MAQYTYTSGARLPGSRYLGNRTAIGPNLARESNKLSLFSCFALRDLQARCSTTQLKGDWVMIRASDGSVNLADVLLHRATHESPVNVATGFEHMSRRRGSHARGWYNIPKSGAGDHCCYRGLGGIQVQVARHNNRSTVRTFKFSYAPKMKRRSRMRRRSFSGRFDQFRERPLHGSLA